MERKLNGDLELLKLEVIKINKFESYKGDSGRRDTKQTYRQRELMTRKLARKLTKESPNIECRLFYDSLHGYAVIRDSSGEVLYPDRALHLQNSGLTPNGYGRHRFVISSKQIKPRKKYN